MPVGKQIQWGSKDTLSDPRLEGLDKHVNNIRRGRPSLQKGGDDGIFKNLEGELPAKPVGYYSEYYVTRKVDGQERDKLRLVLGKNDEIYITGDHYHDFRQILGMPLELRPTVSESDQTRAEALKNLKLEIEKLRNRIVTSESAHKNHLDMINRSFAGYWVNKIRDNPPPDLVLWINALSRASAALTAAQNGNMKLANSNFLRAQLEYKIASKKFITWSEGIEPAARKMQYIIAGVAIVLSTAAVSAFMLTAAAPVGPKAAEIMTVRIAATVAQADEKLIRVAVLELSEEAMLRAELEAMITELESMRVW